MLCVVFRSSFYDPIDTITVTRYTVKWQEMLPILTTLEDVRALAAYLKNKPTGATTAEIKAALGSNIVDPRKITAYLTWKLVDKAGDRFKLSERGWRLARKTTGEQEILRE